MSFVVMLNLGKPHRANYRAYYQQFYRQWCVEQQLKQYHQQLVQQLAYISHKSAEDISAADSAISEEVKGTKRTFVEMNSSSSNEKQAKAVKPSK